MIVLLANLVQIVASCIARELNTELVAGCNLCSVVVHLCGYSISSHQRDVSKDPNVGGRTY